MAGFNVGFGVGLKYNKSIHRINAEGGLDDDIEDALLLENGDVLLMEDGDYIQLESGTMPTLNVNFLF